MLIVLSGSFSPAAANSEMETVELPLTIITASRIPTALENLPGNTVIGRKAIDEINPASVVDLFRWIPGVHIDQQGSRGGISSVYLRGSDPNFTLVMIDGVKVNDPTNMRGGSFDFSGLDADNIERIEIIRGPLSAVHGSDALAGAIHIITREGKPRSEYAANIGLGHEGRYQGHVEAAGPLGESSAFSLFANTSDSGDIADSGSFTGSAVGGKLSIRPSDRFRILGTALYNKSENQSFPDDSGGSKYAVIKRKEQRDAEDLSLGILLRGSLLPQLDLTLRANYYSHQEDIASPGVAPGIRDPFGIPETESDNRFDRTILEISALLSLSDRGWISAGAGTEVEDGKSDSNIFFFGFPVPNSFDLDRRNSSGFLEARLFGPKGLVFNAGLRVDSPEGFDTEYSPRLSVVHHVGETTAWEASWGRGFKLPSFFALGSPIVGNPSLLPETSESYALGVTHAFLDGTLVLRANAFSSRFYDGIDFEEGPPPKMVNRTEIAAAGFDGGIDLWPEGDLSVVVNLSYVNTDIEDTTEELRNRPEWRGDIGLRWQPMPNAILAARFLYVDDVLDSSIPTGDRILDAYTRVDLNGVWEIRPNFQISLHVEDLFDEGYEEYIGFDSPGIQGRITLGYRF